MYESGKRNPEELWDTLASLEFSATNLHQKLLKPYGSALKKIYAAGLQAPTLNSSRSNEPDLRCAALFLKRSLNDLRAVWLLINSGYTSQAASVAASLFENSLAAAVIAGNLDRAAKLLGSTTGELPWNSMQLSKFLAQIWTEDQVEEDKRLDQNEYEKAWRQVYSGYKWLCQIKHPTLPSVVHDSKSAATSDDEYVVMAIPDIRQEDLPLKITILTICASRMIEALKRFVSHVECDREGSEYLRFDDRITKAYREILKENLSRSDMVLPFGIDQTSFADQSRRFFTE